MDLWNVK